MVGGEITTTAWVDLAKLVRAVLGEIGSTCTEAGLCSDSCSIISVIGKQSPDIAQGVDTGGAGDQGVMFGYACRQRDALMPLPIMVAHKLTRRLTEVRQQGILRYLRPDGKPQLMVEYEDGVPVRIDSVVLAARR
jgi:S-adenosylmethionine synthetase